MLKTKEVPICKWFTSWSFHLSFLTCCSNIIDQICPGRDIYNNIVWKLMIWKYSFQTCISICLRFYLFLVSKQNVISCTTEYVFFFFNTRKRGRKTCLIQRVDSYIHFLSIINIVTLWIF